MTNLDFASGRRLATARVNSGLSIKQSARLLRLTPEQVSDHERIGVDQSLIERYCELYGVSLDWLVNGTTFGLQESEAIRGAARSGGAVDGDEVSSLIDFLASVRTPTT